MIVLNCLSQITQIITGDTQVFGNILKFVSHPCKEALMFETTKFGEKFYLLKGYLLVDLRNARKKFSQFF